MRTCRFVLSRHLRAYIVIPVSSRTLADLAGLTHDVDESVDGYSLAPLLQNPSMSNPAAKTAAFSQQAHCLIDPHTNQTIDVWTVADSCTVTPRSQLQYMGYSVRTAQWRFTAWLAWNGTSLGGDWQNINSTELYDHSHDMGVGIAAFDDYENENLASTHPDVASQLLLRLKRHFHTDRTVEQ